jgi:hypothetical protein
MLVGEEESAARGEATPPSGESIARSAKSRPGARGAAGRRRAGQSRIRGVDRVAQALGHAGRAVAPLAGTEARRSRGSRTPRGSLRRRSQRHGRSPAGGFRAETRVRTRFRPRRLASRRARPDVAGTFETGNSLPVSSRASGIPVFPRRSGAARERPRETFRRCWAMTPANWAALARESTLQRPPPLITSSAAVVRALEEHLAAALGARSRPSLGAPADHHDGIAGRSAGNLGSGSPASRFEPCGISGSRRGFSSSRGSLRSVRCRCRTGGCRAGGEWVGAWGRPRHARGQDAVLGRDGRERLVRLPAAAGGGIRSPRSASSPRVTVELVGQDHSPSWVTSRETRSRGSDREGDRLVRADTRDRLRRSCRGTSVLERRRGRRHPGAALRTDPTRRSCSSTGAEGAGHPATSPIRRASVAGLIWDKRGVRSQPGPGPTRASSLAADAAAAVAFLRERPEIDP